MATPPTNPTEYVRTRDFERWQDKYVQRWDDLVNKLNQLTDVVSVNTNRLGTVEGIMNKQSEQSFTKNLTVAQAAWGCVSAFVLIGISTITGIVGSLVVNWLTRH